MPEQMRLTADMFVVHEGEFLVLCRTGLGAGLWYIPGGIVELGEEPIDAAVRETVEESGITVHDAEILRVWSYEPEPEVWAYHATYIGSASHRDVVISAEHTGSRWCSPAEYLATDVAQWAAVDHPVLNSFRPHVERNVQLVAERLAQA